MINKQIPVTVIGGYLGTGKITLLNHTLRINKGIRFAGFAVLDESPLNVDPMKIKDVPVWGMVVGGMKYQAVTQ